MRSFDDWNDDLADDLPDENLQPGLPFDRSAAAKAPDLDDTARLPIVRPPLEALFDAFVSPQQEEKAAPLPPPAVVETEVVSMPVALVLRPRESVALAQIFAPIPVASFGPAPVEQPPVEPSVPEPAAVAPVVAESVVPEAMALEPVAPEAIAAEAVAPQAVVWEAIALEPVALEAIAWEAVAPQAVAPEVIASEAVAPQAVVPDPVIAKDFDFDVTPAVPMPIVFKTAVPEFKTAVPERAVSEPIVVQPVVPDANFEEPFVAKTVLLERPVAKPITVKPVVTNRAPDADGTVVKPPVIKVRPIPAPAPVPEPRVEVAAAVAAPEPARSGGMRRYLAAAAAIVIIVGAIGVPMGKLWATREPEPVVKPEPRAHVTPPAPQPREKRPEPVAAPIPQAVPASAPLAQRMVAPPSASNASSAVANPTAPAAATPRPLTRVQTPDVAPPAVAVLTATAASEPIPVSSTPIALAPPTPVVAAAPVAAAPQPIGPFFETTQVDKAPSVATRVEPQLPSNQPSRVVSDIALVRVLVSQAGHPVLVRMLRPSKGGLAYDDAVMAAVKKWTFTPAVKKGETVTCWLHVAVTLNGAP